MLIFKISVFLNIVAFVFLDDKLILTPPPIIIMNFLCIDIKVFVISIITSLCDKPKILTNTEYFFPWKIDKSLETVNLTTAIIITRSSIYNTIDKEHLVGLLAAITTIILSHPEHNHHIFSQARMWWLGE